MKIGELARVTGLTRSRIRFYEARGVLPAPARSGNGYRDYPSETAAVLSFIDRGQALGFTLAELGKALADSESGIPAGAHLLAGLRRKHAELGRHVRAAIARRRLIDTLIDELERCTPAAEGPSYPDADRAAAGSGR